jgi:phosphopantetheinyl transferase (holo-ACP synthase)
LKVVGNDVVDLTDPEAADGSLHPRFEARVLTRRELAQVATLRGRDATRWRWVFWAAKEAAYKVARASDPTVPFSPRRFEVTMLGPDRATVRHGGVDFAVAVHRNADFVHAVARGRSTSPEALLTGVADIDGIDGEHPSRAARAFAMQAVASRLGLAPSDLRIERAPRRPPVLLFDGAPAASSLSLSHHGRFVAFACALLADEKRREDA